MKSNFLNFQINVFSIYFPFAAFLLRVCIFVRFLINFQNKAARRYCRRSWPCSLQLGDFLLSYKGSNCFDYYNQISRTSMEDSKTPSSETFWTASEKEFECPCGKGYQSYPALFTHIKNKHHGKAPGNIKKPNLPSKRRGRPPVHNKSSFSQTNVTLRSEVDSYSFSQPITPAKLPEDVVQMNTIVKILELLPLEQMDRRRLNEISAIVDMNVYLVSRQRQEGSLRVGWVLSEFLQELSRAVQWGKFQQMLMLLMLWVQYTIDSQSNPRLVAEGQIDILLDNINDFVQVGLAQMTKQFEISHLPIFQQEIVLQLFASVFQWLIAKKYTNYRITLNSEFSPTSS